jgi:hypothetical protein
VQSVPSFAGSSCAAVVASVSILTWLRLFWWIRLGFRVLGYVIAQSTH